MPRTKFTTAKLIDDRGEPCVRSWVPTRALPDSCAKFPTAQYVLAGRRHASRPNTKRFRWYLAFIIVAHLPVVVTVAVVAASPDDPAGLVAITAFMGFCVFTPCLVAVHYFRGGARDRIILATLDPGCLSCLYPLTEIPEKADGCTLCPECGAAWNLDGSTFEASLDPALGSVRPLVIRDDRKQRVGIQADAIVSRTNLQEGDLYESDDDGLRIHRTLRLRAELFRPEPGSWFLLLAVFIIGAMLLAIDLPDRWLIAQRTVGVALLGFVVVRMFIRRQPPSVNPELLELLPPVCAGCGSALDNVVADARGLTVCPECGAAWKLGVTQTPPSEGSP